jgi:hypothetical protein
MPRHFRVRPSPGTALFGGIVGLVFVGIGVFVAIPHAGLFGVFWTLVAAAITAAHFYNAFSSRGIATEIIDASGTESLQGPTPEERLRTLEDLRSKGLITPEEYEQRRSAIINRL